MKWQCYDRHTMPLWQYHHRPTLPLPERVAIRWQWREDGPQQHSLHYTKTRVMLKGRAGNLTLWVGRGMMYA